MKRLGLRNSWWHQVSAVPSWLIVCAARPSLPASHPWHGRRFSLQEWKRGRTLLCCRFDFVFVVLFSVLGSCVVTLLLTGCGGETSRNGDAPELPPLCNLRDHCGEVCLGTQESATSWRPACQCPGSAEVAPLTTVCEVCGEEYTCACMQATDPALQNWRCTDTDAGPLFEQQ
jgi:hypothetical protein